MTNDPCLFHLISALMSSLMLYPLYLLQGLAPKWAAPFGLVQIACFVLTTYINHKNVGDHYFNQHFYLNGPKHTYNSQPSAFSANHLSSTIPNQNHPTPTRKKKNTTSNSPKIVLQSHRVVPKDVEVEPQLFRPALLSPATHIGHRCAAKVLQQLDGLWQRGAELGAGSLLVRHAWEDGGSVPWISVGKNCCTGWHFEKILGDFLGNFWWSFQGLREDIGGWLVGFWWMTGHFSGEFWWNYGKMTCKMR